MSFKNKIIIDEDFKEDRREIKFRKIALSIGEGFAQVQANLGLKERIWIGKRDKISGLSYRKWKD